MDMKIHYCKLSCHLAIGNVDQLLALLYAFKIFTIPNAKPQYKSNTTYNGRTNRAHGHNTNACRHTTESRIIATSL